MKSATMLNFSKSSAADEAELMEMALGGSPKLLPARIFTQGKDGTPGMAAAALGTAHEVRVRRTELWAAARKSKMEEGGRIGRKREARAQ